MDSKKNRTCLIGSSPTHKRRACKANKGSFGRGVAHVERQHIILTAMRFVCHHDDVIALGERGIGFSIFSVELVNERENIAMVFSICRSSCISNLRPSSIMAPRCPSLKRSPRTQNVSMVLICDREAVLMRLSSLSIRYACSGEYS